MPDVPRAAGRQGTLVHDGRGSRSASARRSKHGSAAIWSSPTSAAGRTAPSTNGSESASFIVQELHEVRGVNRGSDELQGLRPGARPT